MKRRMSLAFLMVIFKVFKAEIVFQKMKNMKYVFLKIGEITRRTYVNIYDDR
jgi:hypothetical protein